MALTINSKMGELLADERSKAVLEKYLPGISTNPQIGMAKGFSLKMVAGLAKGQISQEALDGIARDLAALEARAATG